MGETVGGSRRYRGASGGDEMKSMRAVFPISPIRSRSDAWEVVSSFISGMMVAIVVDVASRYSWESDQEDL